MDDFHSISRSKRARRVRSLRHDLEIHLDGDTSLPIADRVEQLRDRERRVERARLAVEEDLHPRIVAASPDPDFTVDDTDRDLLQPRATTRPADARARVERERRAVRGADQLPALDQESTRRPVQAPAGVRAFVVERVHGAVEARDDDRKAARGRLDFGSRRAPLGHVVEAA